MSQRRDIEVKLALYDDLSGILGAMRSFALTESRRVAKRESAQGEIVSTLAATLQDMAAALPPAPPPATDIWLLFGSTRGFCGSFNEDVSRAWKEAGGPELPTIVVGERLAARMDAGDSRIVSVPGPVGVHDAPAVIDGILFATAGIRRRLPGEAGLVVCFRDEETTRSERLLPLPPVKNTVGGSLPLTQEAAGHVAQRLVEHFLFHSLLSRLLHAIRVENRMRLMQMETALQHLARGGEELQRQRNRLRQEEIVEEIELILQDRDDAGIT